MPTLIQNVLDGRPCANVAIWRIAVKQLVGVLDRLEQPSTPIDASFVRDVMEVSEADTRLGICAESLEIDVAKESDWCAIDDRLPEFQALALGVDEGFELQLMLRLRDKGLLPSHMMDFGEKMRDLDQE